MAPVRKRTAKLRAYQKRHKKGQLYHETAGPNQCQCDISCGRPAVKGSPFCATHKDSCQNGSPLSGWEPDFHPELWNARQGFRETHNCFSYAMNVYDPRQVAKCKSKDDCNAPFHQPGSAAGYPGFSNSVPKTCPNMLARIFGDNPTIQMADFGSKCPAGYSKIALIIDESDDYHFLRQDSNGYWSHKPGARSVTNVDARNHLIWNPRLANYDYKAAGDGDLNYDIFCSFMCVPRNRPLYLRVGGAGSSQIAESLVL